MAKLKDDQIKWILSLDAKGVQSELKTISSQSNTLIERNKILSKEVEAATKQMVKAEAQMQKLEVAGKGNSTQYKELENTVKETRKEIDFYTRSIRENEKTIKQNTKIADEMVRTLKVEDMTMAQLEKTAKNLEHQMKHTAKSTSPEAYQSLKKELDTVNGRMAELKGGTKDAEKEFSLFSQKGIKGAAMLTAGVIAAEKAVDGFLNLMMSNKATANPMKAELDGLNNAWDYMKTAIANLDFTNFFQNMKEAITLGKEASIMLQELFERENSFRLTSAPIRAEIENMKTDMRDANLPMEDRIKLGEKVIQQVEKLADEEKELAQQRVDAYVKELTSQTDLTEAEREFVIVNYNSNRDQILHAKQVIELENKRIKTKIASSSYEMDMNNRFNTGIEEQIQNFKKSKTYSEEAHAAMKKYLMGSDEGIANFVNSLDTMLSIDIKTRRENRMTERLVNQMKKQQTDKSLGGTTPEQRQRKALNKLNQDLEIEYQKKIVEIKEKYAQGEIQTQAERDRQIFAAESAYYLLRKSQLETFLIESKHLEVGVKSDVNKQITDLDNKRLDQEEKFRISLERVLMNADPATKEKYEYDERLSALGLFGVAKEDMTTEQMKALELLQQQHNDKINDIARQAEVRKNTQSEKEFDEAFSARKEELQLELNQLMQVQAATGKLGFDAEMEVHMKRLQMLHEEIEARKDANLDIEKQTKDLGRIEAQMTNTIRKENEKRTTDYSKYASDIATATNSFFSGQQSGLEAFGGAMIDIMFDILSQIINQKIMEATAVAVAEQAKAAAIAAAMPDSVFTFGASAVARTAAIGAIIMGALQVAKGALKGMVGKKSSNSSSSSSSGGGPSSSGSIKVNRKSFADGGYNDAGASGGYTGSGGRYEVAGMFANGAQYHRGEYIIAQPELKIPSVLSMVRNIEGIRRQRTSANSMPFGFAEGGANFNYSGVSSPGTDFASIIDKLTNAIEVFNNKEVNIGASELQAKLNALNKHNESFSQSI